MALRGNRLLWRQCDLVFAGADPLNPPQRRVVLVNIGHRSSRQCEVVHKPPNLSASLGYDLLAMAGDVWVMNNWQDINSCFGYRPKRFRPDAAARVS